MMRTDALGTLLHGKVSTMIVFGGPMVLTVDKSDIAELNAGHP